MVAQDNARITQEQKANERDLRAQSGSRFNIWYKNGFPEGATKPESVMSTLNAYVDFGGPSQGPSTGMQRMPEPAGGNGPGLSAIHKGLTIAQVEQVLGPAMQVSQQNEGSIQITLREYSTEDGLNVKAKFAGGVLFDYTAGPKQ